MQIGPESMNDGAKKYLKHFGIGFTFMCAGTGMSLIGLPVLPQILFLASVIYVLLVLLGLWCRIGPFAYIGKLYIHSAGITEAPSKNRWPDA